MKKIRVGQIGIGHNHGEEKMRAFRKFPELFEIVGFSEDDEDWLKKRGGLKGYEGLRRFSKAELLSQCDAIIVETAVPDLTATAMECVQAGKHIHLDKPGSGTLEEFEEMMNTARKNGCVVQMGYMYRYNPAVMKAIEMVRRGDLGKIYSINAEMSTNHGIEYRRWLKTFKGGIQYILGSHMVDLIVYIMGEPHKVTSFLKHSMKDGVDVEDNNLSVLEYEHALAKIYVSSVEVNGYGRRQFVISGSKGTVNICPMENPIRMTFADNLSNEVIYYDVKKDIEVEAVDRDSRYDVMVQDFYDYVMGTKENPYTYDHDIMVQRVLCKMIQG